MGKIIKNGKEYKFGTSVGFQTGGDTIEILTQAEYDELVAAGATDDDIYYFIEDEKNGEVLVNASNVSYDNSESGLVATDVQGAVDEIDGKVDEISTDVTELNQKTDTIKTYVGSDGKLHFTDASGADSVLPFNKGVILTKSVTVGSSNVTSVSFSIASDYADYKNLKINNLVIQMPYDSGNDAVAKCSEVPNMSGIPRIKYTYTASTGKITASVTTNVMFKEVYFYRGFEYVFKVAIIGN